MTNQDFSNVKSLGVQISTDGQRVWVCVNGQCVLRAKGIEVLDVRDDRILHEAVEEPARGSDDAL